MSDTPKHLTTVHWTRAGIDLLAFLAGWALGWFVFGNIALGLVLALIFSGGTATAQRVSKPR
jgi:hypothetical protein